MRGVRLSLRLRRARVLRRVGRPSRSEPSQLMAVGVTAAYATITDRLGVVVTRLLAAAFWLVAENR
jgi:hypothetical protein